MKKIVLFALVITLIGSVSRAQRFMPDAADGHFKGAVKSVLTTVRTPQGRVVGQPVRNYFNKDGYYTRNIYYDTLGSPVMMISYTYDTKNRLVKDVRTHEPYSEPLSQTTYEYNGKNKTITATVFGIADSLEQKVVYNFDKKNVLQSVVTYDEENKQIVASEYQYNDYGYRTLIKHTEGANNIYCGTDKIRYDTEGFVAEKCSYYLTTLRQAFLYTYYYDEQGNWISAYVFHVTPTEGYLYQVITRQINYYD